MKSFAVALTALSAAVLASTPARGAEVFGGLFAHDIDSPLSKSDVEDGMDVQIGWRGDPIGGTPLQPYAFASVNSAGDTHFAAAGISAKLGDQLFIRPGVGIAVHTGLTREFNDPTNDRIEFGSRVLFAPELGVGARINERTTVEASWVHMSHARLFGEQNPGVDHVGVRLSFRL